MSTNNTKKIDLTLLDMNEAMRLLRIKSRATMHKIMINEKALPHRRIGGKILFTLEDLAEYIEKSKV